MNRRILLIDADPAFRALLAQQLERYRFDVTAEPDPEQALAQGSAAPPALLVVSVEEPDKAGFKVFQRCKKGALAKVPIVLVTSSVPPESFAKHRGLKVHADEYIDKRTVSDDELLGKIDNLVGLGEPAGDDLGMSLEVDEIPLSSDDMVLEETVGEDDADTGGEPRVDSMVDAETDAAFAALLGDDAPPAPAAEHRAEDPAEPAAENLDTPHHDADPLAAPEPPPQLIDTPRTSDEEPSVVIAAVPAAIHEASRPQDSGGVEFDSFSRESMRPPVDLIARARQDHRDHAAHFVEAHESVSTIPIDVDDLEQVEDEASSAHVPAPAPRASAEPEVHKRRFIEASTVVEARPHAPAAARQTPAMGHSASPIPDLGLDEIAATETTTDHSGVFDRRALRKLGELERQIVQLKTELDRARATADASARGTNREREFLNLREQIIAKDKDLHRAKDDLRARDRDLADAQDRLRDAEHGRAALEVRAGELEQRGAADANRAATLEMRDKANGSQLAALHQELEARTHAATTAEAARVQLERDLAAERALRAANASDAERSLRVEREQLLARHQAELTAVRNEAAGAHGAALQALREELEGDHAAAIVVATESTRAEFVTHAARMTGELDARYSSDLARLKAEHVEAIAQLTDERDAALARVASEREAAVEAAEDEHHELIARLQTERAAELAAAREDAAVQLSHARDELTAELAYVRKEAETRIAATTTARDRAVAELAAELDRVKSQLAQARAEHEEALGAAAADEAAALDEQASLHAEELARREQDHAAARAEATEASSAALTALRAELERQTAHHGGTLEAARKKLDDVIEQHEHAKGTMVEQHRRAADELAQRHADELAHVHDDKQRAIEGLQHAVAEREAAARAAVKALDDQKALHERALAVAHGEVLRTKAVADAEHAKEIAVLNTEHERQRQEAHAEHTKLAGELAGERDELRRGLSSARDGSRRSEAELAAAVQTIADRNAELRGHAAAITERDQRIADLRRELEALEQENANYQEQVLRAYQKIKADEAMVARAKKAMAIALTVLDDPSNPKSEPT